MEITIQILSIFLLFIFTIFILKKNNVFSFKRNSDFFILKNRKTIVLLILFFFFIITRILLIDKIPYGLNLDEASAGYDAYNLLNYGVDRHLQSFPVYFTAWGGGQNALYTYILIPFINFLGLSLFSVRLPMAIISCISMIYLFLIFKNRYGTNINKLLLVILFIGVTPYLFMKSRWGLESNLLPELLILIYYNFDKFLLNKNNKINFYLSFVFIGISCYSYSITFMFMPIFVLSLIYYFTIKKKQIPIQMFLFGIIITLLITFPLIIFVIINTFHFQSINIGVFTIPLLESNRMATIFSINPIMNFINSILFIFTSHDVGIYNKMPNSLNISYICYLIIIIMICFKLIDFFKNKKKKCNENYDLLKCFILPSILLCLFCTPNINRLNIVIMTLIIFCIYIFVDFFENVLPSKKKLKIILATFIIIEFIFSIFTYINIYNKPFDLNFNSIIYQKSKYAEKNNKNIYLYSDVSNFYMYYLFGSKTSPIILNTNNKKDNQIFFEDYPYININNKYFHNQPLILDKNNIYIFDKNKNSKKQLENIENMLKNKSFEYTINYIDGYTIIET